MNFKTLLLSALWFFSTSLNLSLATECAPFYCNLDSNTDIVQSNGTINGILTFPIGVNSTAASFDGTAHVSFTDTIFNDPSASVSLWFKKNSTDLKGGIIEIGQIGSLNSLGIFYANSNNIYLEMRNSNNQYKVVFAENALSQTVYNHIVVIWDMRDNTYHMKLFINGRYVGGDNLSGPFVHNHGFMRVGIAGVGEWYGYGEGVVDELRFFDWALGDGEVYGEYVYSSNKYKSQPTGKPLSTGPVKVNGKILTVNDEPFTIKGVGYQPIPIGESPSRAVLDYVFSNLDIIKRDMYYLKNMNTNTVRLWAQLTDATLLDALESAGIYAIMAFQVPSSADEPGIDYSDPATISYYVSEMTNYVNQFKNHPAVLAWAIGNENNLHYSGDISDWYKLANKLAQAAYDAEKPAYHPTILVNGYMLFFGDADYSSDDVSLNYVDIWGHNNYVRYDHNSYFCYFDKITAKPLIITEFGVDAYGDGLPTENEHLQAEWVIHEWNQIKNNCLGGTVMEYCDEWWKCGLPLTHDLCGYYTDVQPDNFSHEEWYGIMAVEQSPTSVDIMHPREIYCALRRAFRDCPLLGDFDSDCNVNFRDFSLLCLHWLQSNCYENDCCNGVDLDNNDEVNLSDLGILCERWLESGE